VTSLGRRSVSTVSAKDYRGQLGIAHYDRRVRHKLSFYARFVQICGAERLMVQIFLSVMNCSL
jgi:hypothetical protein